MTEQTTALKFTQRELKLLLNGVLQQQGQIKPYFDQHGVNYIYKNNVDTFKVGEMISSLDYLQLVISEQIIK